ncbi:DUF4139 domain-containing protein [bacterium]|nr:DUF4139 domain-containing protein [bacterium]
MAEQAKEVATPQEVAVTIYNEDLALIREVREVELDAGTGVYRLPEVSGRLKPETVHLSLPAGVEFKLLEQNYDYDLVSVDKLLEKFIGREIVLIDDEHDLTIKGTLLSTQGGRVVRDDSGQILVNPLGRVILPPGSADELLLRPTLSWNLWSAAAGRQPAEISYLSGGLSWLADYVVLLNADDTAGDIEGWVTVKNYSGTTYRDARLKLVAGDVNIVKQKVLPPPQAGMMLRSATMAAPEGFQEEEFFEYHLYDLPRPTTLKTSQMKQIGLLTAAAVPFEKLLIFNGINGGDVRVVMEFTNEEEAGMGMPLPAGTVRVFKNDSSGDAQFIGEDRIDHTPKDEDVQLKIGNAFDIVGETKRTEYNKLKKGYDSAYEVTLKNHKAQEDVVVTVPVKVMGDWKMLEASHEYAMKDAFTAEFKMKVPADGEVTLTFKFKVTWK